MSRNEQRIRKAAAACGWEVTDISWSPLGGNVEMQGPEGGWYVELDNGERSDFVGGLNVEEVLEQLGYLRARTARVREA